MGGTRRVPWADWDEWETVRAGLSGDDVSLRDVAIAKVAAWRLRGRVPHAVDCTASLLETRSLDFGVAAGSNTDTSTSSTHVSENILRLAYAASIVRMVNGAVDPSQKGRYAAPVMTLAKRLGIPIVLVDVRMAASHQEMPKLSLLRHASERALQWLFERYWQAQRLQIDELKKGARHAAVELVRAEFLRRAKAEKNTQKALANRGKGTRKSRKKSHGGSVAISDDSDEGDSDDDLDDEGGDTISGDGDADAVEKTDDEDANPKPEMDIAIHSPKKLRKHATNKFHAACAKDDLRTVVDALIYVGLGCARGGTDTDTDTTNKPSLLDWKLVVKRLAKRWNAAVEELFLLASEEALSVCGVGVGDELDDAATVAGDTEDATSAGDDDVVCANSQENSEDGLARLAAAATELLGESFAASKKNQPDTKKENSRVTDRQEKLVWWITKQALRVARDTMTPAMKGFVMTLCANAPGAGRSFRAGAARLLGDFSGADDGADKNVTPGVHGCVDPTEVEDDDCAFLIAARRGLALRRKSAAGGTPGGGKKKTNGKRRRGETKTTATRSGSDDEDEKEFPGAERLTRFGAFTKVTDWTPCAVGDLPKHLRLAGDNTDPLHGAKRVDPDDALGLASAKAREDETREKLETQKSQKPQKADLLWAKWPPEQFCGFGFVTENVNYSVGLPFVDTTRRLVSGPAGLSVHTRDGDTQKNDTTNDAQNNRTNYRYVPDEAVVAAGEIASGRFSVHSALDHQTRLDKIASAPLQTSMTHALCSLEFLDPDDDSETEAMDVRREAGDGAVGASRSGGVASDAGDGADATSQGDDDDNSHGGWGYDDPVDFAEDEPSPSGEIDGSDDDDDAGVALRVGGVRVKLSELDRKNVAADVECLL